MRILIDMQGAQSMSRERGIGRYSRSFTKAFIDHSAEHEVYILLNMLFPDSAESIQNDYKTILPWYHFVKFYGVGPADELNPENEWHIKASELMREKVIEDIAPDFVVITSLFEGGLDNTITSIGRYTGEIPTAVIFYDLIPFISPGKFLAFEPMKRWYGRKIDSLRRADLLLAISDSARGEVITYLDFDPSKIINISSATDSSFDPAHKTPGIKEKYHITCPFIMHTSAYEPRKNFEGLIEAFALLPEALRSEYQLVLVCKLQEAHKEALEQAATESGLKAGDVILTGFVPDDDLISLYSECSLFVFPSLHEGFGLPVLEAMSCGAAVIGSNSTSIPEVIGREDALFDPQSPKNIAEKIYEVLTDSNFSNALKEHAARQVKKFSWDNTAIRAIKFLEKARQQNITKESRMNVYHSTLRLIDQIRSMGCAKRPSDNDLIQAAIVIEENEKACRRLLSYMICGRISKWRVEGPFDSSYSLALVNREIAMALALLGLEVALHSTEGSGDFDPDPIFLEKYPEIAHLYHNSRLMTEEMADVTSRNLYPPRVSDMHSGINLLHNYAWEESAFPQEWIEHFNRSLQGMVLTSNYVKKIMIDNGVTVPLFVSGNGVDHWERIRPNNDYKISAKAFCFLHVSSCFPRKGVDVLLKAYGKAFSSQDNVSLVIKTFENPHNMVHLWLSEAKEENSNFPDVLIIEEDLTDEELKALYEQCHTLVGPSRAEGFGLPFAEAMLSGLPVIATGWGGQLDFCNHETAWLIDYNFTPAQTHFELFDSVWAEPSAEHLAFLMREVYALPVEQRVQRSEQGRKVLLENFKWTDVAERLVSASKTVDNPDQPLMPKIGWISSWNTKCGIASYSKHLIDALKQDIVLLAAHDDQLISEDSANVHRCWRAGDGNSLDTLALTIEKLKLDTLVIQFNYSFFDFDHFGDFLEIQSTLGRTIVLILHATTDSDLTPHKQLIMLTPIMQSLDRLLVHTPDDLNRLKSYGLVDNVALFPHGILDWEPKRKRVADPFVLATYGFFLPHKGLQEIVDSVKILIDRGLNLKLKMVNAEYPVPLSAALISDITRHIELLGLSEKIELITDFLPDELSLEHLGSADLLIFPYQETGESSSASVRYGLATGNPVAVTPVKIFSDVDQAVYTLPGCGPREIAAGIEEIMNEIKENSKATQEKRVEAERWCKAHRYSALGERLGRMLIALKASPLPLN